MATETSVTFGDPTVELTQVDRYKGIKGRTDRIAILSTLVLKAHRYYDEATKQKFRAPADKELMEALRKQRGEPEQRFAVVIFVYETNDQGELLEPEKLKGKVRIWEFSEARYAQLSQTAAQWPLLDFDKDTKAGGHKVKQIDFLAKCTEERFQRLEFTPLPTAHWKSKDEKWYLALKAKESKTQKQASQALGKDLEKDEVMKLLGMAAPAASGNTDNAGDIDLGSVFDE